MIRELPEQHPSMVQLPAPPPGPPPEGSLQQQRHPGEMHHPGVAKSPMTKEQKLAIALSITGLAVLITSLSKSWFLIGSGWDGGGVGPSGVEACGMGVCREVPWSMMTGRGGLGSDVPIVATIGMIAAIVAAAGLIGAGVLVWMKDMLHRIPIQPTQIALGIAVFGCTLMELRLLTAHLGDKGSIGSAAVVGIAALGVSAVLLRKLSPRVAMAKAHAMSPSQLPGGQAYGAPMGWPLQPFAGQPQPFTGQPQPFTGQPQPFTGQPQPFTGQPPGVPSVPATQTGSSCPHCQHSLAFVAQYQRWFCESCRQYA